MEKVTFICDWCGVERTEPETGRPAYAIVQRDGWITGLNAELTLREKHSHDDKIGVIFVFPNEMHQEKTETKPHHYEHTLCPSCVDALRDSVRNTREARIAKRKTP